MTHSDALRLEKLLKKQKGGIGLQKIMQSS